MTTIKDLPQAVIGQLFALLEDPRGLAALCKVTWQCACDNVLMVDWALKVHT